MLAAFLVAVLVINVFVMVFYAGRIDDLRERIAILEDEREEL